MPDTPHNPLEGDKPDLTINMDQAATDELISIIIVHNDRPEYLNLLLQSITVCSFNNNYEIIVVDNGSGKDSQDFLDEIKDNVKVVRNEKNLFWSEAANKGVSAADKNSKYFVFLHHDVVITNPSWLDLLIHVSQSKDSGFVGVEIHNYMLSNQKVEFIQEWLCLFTRPAFEDLGGWPQKLPQIGPAFIITAKAQFRGWKPQVMKTAIAHHYKIFAMDISEHERLVEQAMVVLPRLLHEAQTVPVKTI